MSGVDAVQRTSYVQGQHVENEPVAAKAGIERRSVGTTTEAEARLLAHASPDTLIEALQIFSRDAQKDAGTSAILNKKAAIDSARHAIEVALARAAREASEKSQWQKLTSTLSTVAKVAAVTAAVGSVLASGGATAPAIVALSGTLVSTFAKDINKAVGGNEMSGYALMIGGVALSLGGSGAALFSNAAALPQQATTTMRIGSAMVKGGSALGGAAVVASAGTMLQAGLHGAAETEARGDEKAIRAQQKQLMRDMELLIDVLKEVQKSFDSSMSSLASARESQAASSLTLHAGIRA